MVEAALGRELALIRGLGGGVPAEEVLVGLEVRQRVGPALSAATWPKVSSG
jgi:hypothetical protein